MATAPQPATDMRGFVAGPSNRGTLDILWSCVSTIIICAWTSLHPDVYIPKNARQADYQALPGKFALALVMLIAPEMILGIVVSEFLEVHNFVRDVNAAFPVCAWTLTDGYFAIMDGYMYDGHVVDSAQVLELMRSGAIDPVPSDVSGLWDRSKANSLAKLIACFQVTWLMVQCLARTVEGLPMSTLELGTVGYAFITIAAYGFQWHKPKDIRTHTILRPKADAAASAGSASSVHSAVELTSMANNAEDHAGSTRGSHEIALEEEANQQDHELIDLERQNSRNTNSGNTPISARAPDISWAAALSKKYEVTVVYLVFAVASPIYGVWHCLAWNFSFPSRAEMWLWRIDSVVCVTAGTAFLLLCWYYRENVTIWIVWIVFAHVTTRLMILVEMFIGLRSLPAGVFETVRWTTFIPHI
ncbi:hypothetical protein DENSPDRAFT_638508 [Dentipellis sp. KUC8613]|nr:hypothetical protein DENSPDRAFT_638508 [Dentipellis sp. KUC8613]